MDLLTALALLLPLAAVTCLGAWLLVRWMRSRGGWWVD